MKMIMKSLFFFKNRLFINLNDLNKYSLLLLNFYYKKNKIYQANCGDCHHRRNKVQFAIVNICHEYHVATKVIHHQISDITSKRHLSVEQQIDVSFIIGNICYYLRLSHIDSSLHHTGKIGCVFMMTLIKFRFISSQYCGSQAIQVQIGDWYSWVRFAEKSLNYRNFVSGKIGKVKLARYAQRELTKVLYVAELSMPFRFFWRIVLKLETTPLDV